MDAGIITVKTSHTNNYIIHNRETIIVDAGTPGSVEKFYSAFRQHQISLESVKLIVLTHGHWDHIGCAHKLRESTGAAVVSAEPDKLWVENGLKCIPSPAGIWGRAFSPFFHMSKPFASLEPSKVDINLSDRVLPLNSYGMDGSIIRTPGHTAGSLSILMRNGDAFVGDLLTNGFPLRLGAGIMTLGDDAEEMHANLNFLLKLGARRFFPGHGKPFEAERLGKHELAEQKAHRSIIMPGHARTCIHK